MGATKFGSHYLSTWDTCKRKWWLSRRAPHPAGGQGLTPLIPPKPLVLGTIVHSGLEAYLRSGWQDGDYKVEAADEAVSDYLATHPHDFVDGEAADVVEMESRQLLYRYHDWYGPGGVTPDYPTLKVLADDKGPIIEREYELQLGAGWVFTCRVDAVVQWRDWVYVLEHKTCAPGGVSRLRTSMRVSGQSTAECFVLGTALPHLATQGVMLNILVKNRSANSRSKEPPFVRDTIPRTPEQLTQFQNDVLRRLREIEAHEVEYEGLVQQGLTPWEAAARVYPLNGTSNGSCYGFSRCPYLEMCAMPGHEEGLVVGYRPNDRDVEEVKAPDAL